MGAFHVFGFAIALSLGLLKLISDSLVLDGEFIELLLEATLLGDSRPCTKFNFFVEDFLLLLKFGNLSLSLLVILLILINCLTHLFLVLLLNLHDLTLLLVGTLVLVFITFLLICLNVVLEHAVGILKVRLQLLLLLLLEVMFSQPKSFVFLELSRKFRVLSIDFIELNLPSLGLFSSARLTS
jgi:hypothetical protein